MQPVDLCSGHEITKYKRKVLSQKMVWNDRVKEIRQCLVNGETESRMMYGAMSSTERYTMLPVSSVPGGAPQNPEVGKRVFKMRVTWVQSRSTLTLAVPIDRIVIAIWPWFGQ
jgi:hypothetical protein